MSATAAASLKLSFVIPVLNEAEALPDTLQALQSWRALGHQVVVADGGSTDQTVRMAGPLADQIVSTSSGRAAQMNGGATRASGDVLVFLHADTVLPATTPKCLTDCYSRPGFLWGHFDIALSSPQPVFRLIETLINWRSRLSGIATGDQAIFVSAACFADIGGYANLPLMEDVEICTRLRRLGRAARPADRALTSSRRWEHRGIIKTVLLMWTLRLRYFLGADPQRLAEIYHG